MISTEQKTTSSYDFPISIEDIEAAYDEICMLPSACEWGMFADASKCCPLGAMVRKRYHVKQGSAWYDKAHHGNDTIAMSVAKLLGINAGNVESFYGGFDTEWRGNIHSKKVASPSYDAGVFVARRLRAKFYPEATPGNLEAGA